LRYAIFVCGVHSLIDNDLSYQRYYIPTARAKKNRLSGVFLFLLSAKTSIDRPFRQQDHIPRALGIVGAYHIAASSRAMMPT
jgi:hypothetical protein